MQQLGLTDCQELLDVTAELVSAHDARALAQCLLRRLRDLIPHPFGGCHFIQPGRRQIDPRYAPQRAVVPAEHKDFWRLTQTHPLYRRLFSHPAKAWKLSDVISRRAFLRTECYHALYGPWGMDRELAGAVPCEETPGAYLWVSLYRARHDFTERDRILLNLLLPQIATAWRRLAANGRAAADSQRRFTEEPTFCEWLRRQTNWGLTQRESQVLFWLCQGKTNAEIGRILDIAERTAETHTLSLYPKMGVENRYTAIAEVNRLAAL